MRVLLDTHVLLQWASTAEQLSDTARDVISDGSTEVLVSAASFYEISVKFALGRLELPSDPGTYLPRTVRRHRFGILAIDGSHALRAGALPVIHRDPWDRLLIGQAVAETVPIVTADPAIARYDVEVIW